MAPTNVNTHIPSTAEEFLAKCEEELKDRFTEKDEAFMEVFNAEKPTPPIIESWWVHNNRRRDHRRDNRRHNHRRGPYDRPSGNRDNYNTRPDYNRGYQQHRY